MYSLATHLQRIAGAAVVAVGFALAAPITASAQTPVTLDAPVIVTSLGQSLDAFSLQLAVKRAGVEPDYDGHIEADHVEASDAKTLFLAVGASVKGFGEAGISIEQELARAGHLIDAAKKKGMKIVMVHLGGKDRRDDLSDQLIKLVAPRSDVIIVVPGSDDDGLMKGIADKGGIAYRTTKSAITLAEDIKAAFGSGS
jgi:hypothetical protein